MNDGDYDGCRQMRFKKLSTKLTDENALLNSGMNVKCFCVHWPPSDWEIQHIPYILASMFIIHLITARCIFQASCFVSCVVCL